MHGLDLDPARAAPAGRIRRADRLDDDALVPRGERVARHALGDLGVVGDLAGDAMVGRDALELGDARRERLVEQVAPVDVQHVEEPRMQQRLACGLGAEARHRVLERTRPAVFVERERLAVEDHVVHRHPLHDVDDLGQPVRDVGEVAGEDAHVVARAVHLDARAVELVFDGCLAGRLDGLGRAGGGGGEHREHRAPDDESDRVELCGVAGECEAGGLAEVARQHGRAAHDVAGAVGGASDRVGDHAFEGAGAHVAEQHAAEEALFALGCPRRELAQRPGAFARRPGTGRDGEPVEQLVELGDRERGLCGGLPHRGGDPAPSDADPALPRLAHEEPHRGRDLVGLEPAEQVGKRVDLGQPRARRCDGVGRGHELVEQHEVSLASASDKRGVRSWPTSRSTPSPSSRRTSPAR